MALAGLVLLALGLAIQAGKLDAARATAAPAVEAPGPTRPPSCYEVGVEVPAQRVSLDARCDALRCPAGAHAEWWVTLGRVSRVRCVEGP